MDFDLDHDLDAVRDLAREVLAAEATTDRVRAVERSEAALDERLWATLGSTGLLGVALPEEYGGAGLGVPALAVLLQEQGRVVAPVPVWSHGVGAHLVASYAAPDLAGPLLAGLVTGERRIVVALEEHGGHDPAAPSASAVADGSGSWRLSGTKALVPTAAGADHVVVSATTQAGPGLFLLDATADGLRWEHASVTTYDVAADLHLDGVSAVALGAPGDDALAAALSVAAIALAALQVGVCEGALAHAATYLTEREQFGRPLGSFQAVQHQLADCWIEIQAMSVCLWQAISDLDSADDLARSASVAKWWSAQAGLDLVHRVQHVHGGMGVDVDYPVHRHFLWGKQIANTLGGAEASLVELGAALVDEAARR